jgi:hypothetical protein
MTAAAARKPRTPRKPAPEGVASTKRPSLRGKAAQQEKELAKRLAACEQVALEKGAVRVHGQFELATPIGRMVLRIYMNRISGSFEDDPQRAHRSLPGMVGARGEWNPWGSSPDSLAVGLYAILAATPAPAEHEKPWPPTDRAPLKPLDLKPSERKPAEPAVYFRVVRRAEYLQRLQGALPPVWSTDPDDAILVTEPNCNYRSDAVRCDSVAEAKAHAEDLVAQVLTLDDQAGPPRRRADLREARRARLPPGRRRHPRRRHRSPPPPPPRALPRVQGNRLPHLRLRPARRRAGPAPARERMTMDDLESLFMLLAGANDEQLARIGQAVSDYRDALTPHDDSWILSEVDDRARDIVDALARDVRATDRKLATSLFAAPMASVEDLRALLGILESVPGADAATVFSRVLSAYAFRLAREHTDLKSALGPKPLLRCDQESNPS